MVAEARARADALQAEANQLRSKLDQAVAAQQQDGVSQVITQQWLSSSSSP